MLKRSFCSFFVALVVSACAAPAGHLYAIRDRGGISIEYRQEVGTFRKKEVRLPLADCGFYTKTTSGEGGVPVSREVWRVMSLDPDRITREIRYGEVPPGFMQVTPTRSEAPALEEGKTYQVECSGDRIGLTEFELSPMSEREGAPSSN